MDMLGNIAYKRENVADEYAWQKVGRLYLDVERWKCKIALFAYHQGLCIAKSERFLRGEIVYPVELKDGAVNYVFCGAIMPGENETGETVHAIRFEAFPLCRPLYGNNLWLTVNLDDAEGYKPQKETPCPF